MNAEQGRAIDDLAFLRALADGGGDSQAATGAGLLAGGALYGLQCLIFAAQAYGWLQFDELGGMIFGIGPTVVFLIAIFWITWRYREQSHSGGVAARALRAAFASSGTATIALLCIFAWAAYREQSLTIWFLYPCSVFALQGGAWMIAWLLRRRAWLGVVAFGWLLSSVVLSVTIGTRLYPIVAGLSLVLLMAVPGALMMRPATN